MARSARQKASQLKAAKASAAKRRLIKGISVGPALRGVSTKYPSTPLPLKGGRAKVVGGEFRNQWGQKITEKQYHELHLQDRRDASRSQLLASLNSKPSKPSKPYKRKKKG